MSGTKGVPSLWSGMDRKALAIGEFTLRQQRKRLSTWVVLIVGIAAMGVLTMFYVDATTRDYEAIDNDGDSYDWDGDGYPNGQEQRYGTDIFDENSHPGVLDRPSYRTTRAYGSTRTTLTGMRLKWAASATTTTAIAMLSLGRPRKKTPTTTAYPVTFASQPTVGTREPT